MCLRRGYLALLSLVALVCTIALAVVFLVLRDPHKQPHIVFILADDLGWNDVSYNGCPQIRTPNIDALAWNGIRFQRYYTQPYCTPSRAAFLSGRYPIHLGMQHLVVLSEEPRGLPLHIKILPQWLGSLGYVTHLIGKWHLGFFKNEYTPTMRGFQRYVGVLGGNVDYYSHQRCFAGPSRSLGLDLRRGLSVSRKDSGRYLTQLYTEEAISVIESHPKDKPLFLYLSHQAPHSGDIGNPLQAPEKYTKPYSDIGLRNRTLYAGMVSALDESVGAVFEALDRTGMLNDTVVVFSSDNGADTASAYANYASSWPLKGQKGTPWEGGVRAPAILWSPRFHRTLGTVYDNLFHISDWLPTLYHLAGGNPSALGEIDGVSQLLALTREQKTPPRNDVLVNIDPIDNYSAIIEGDFKLVQGVSRKGAFDEWYPLPGNVRWDHVGPREECENSVVARVLRSSGLKPVCGLRPNVYATPVQCRARDASKECAPTVSPCLFNLSDDPCEVRNIAEQHQEISRRLLSRLRHHERTSLPPSNVPMDPKSDPALHGYVWVPWADFPS